MALDVAAAQPAALPRWRTLARTFLGLLRPPHVCARLRSASAAPALSLLHLTVFSSPRLSMTPVRLPPQLMTAFCNRQGVAMSSVRFLFDGSRISPNQTPQELEMEDGGKLTPASHLAQRRARRTLHDPRATAS